MAVVTGEVRMAEMMDFITNQRAGERRSWAFIIDTSHSSLELPSEELWKVADFAGAEFAKSPMGPVAIIASEPAQYGLSRMYQSYSEITGRKNVGVFRTLDEAQRWLATQS
jgi:hypothetical protein